MACINRLLDITKGVGGLLLDEPEMEKLEMKVSEMAAPVIMEPEIKQPEIKNMSLGAEY